MYVENNSFRSSSPTFLPGNVNSLEQAEKLILFFTFVASAAVSESQIGAVDATPSEKPKLSSVPEVVHDCDVIESKNGSSGSPTKILERRVSEGQGRKCHS